MGTILNAQCDCGFAKTEIFVGRGFKPEYLYVPAYCTKCKSLQITNCLDKMNKCPECRGELTLYTQDSLLEKSASTDKYDNNLFFEVTPDGKRQLRLPDTYYLCPNCRKTALRFISTGMWD